MASMIRDAASNARANLNAIMGVLEPRLEGHITFTTLPQSATRYQVTDKGIIIPVMGVMIRRTSAVCSMLRGELSRRRLGGRGRL